MTKHFIAKDDFVVGKLNVPAGEENAEDNHDNPEMDFEKLRYIENPTAINKDRLPQTLRDCVGCLEKLPLLQPNADANNPQTIVDLINSEMYLPTEDDAASGNHPSSHAIKQKKVMHWGAFGIFGHTVRPGCISFYKKYETIYCVSEGRWWMLGDWLVKWMSDNKNISLDTNLIKTDDNQVLIIRIIQGQVGLITIQGVFHLLDVGTHVFNTGTVKFYGAQTYSEKLYFNHGPYHYLNVPRGKNAKVWAEVVDSNGSNSLVPRLIKEGEHFIKSNFFKYCNMVSMSDEYIGHDSIHILNVVKGCVAKANCDNLPRLYGEGLHIVESPNFSFKGTELVSPENLCITHGTITILQVPRGKIALLWNRNEPYLIDKPGLYEFNSNNVHFVEFVDAAERFIELGSKKVIQVYTGEVGITYDKGHLKVLKNGRHVIDSSTHVFERFLSTKQRSIRLITYGADHKINKTTGTKYEHDFDDDSDLLVCETKDLVKVGVRADVFYSISDPEKCIQTLNTEELEDLVRETAVATLTNIIRSTALNQIAQSRQISAGPEEDVVAANVTALEDDAAAAEGADEQAGVVSYFFDRAHDEFMTKLHEDFVTRYGVDIANIRMESLKIMDTELANEIAQNCLTTASVENQLSNLQGQNLIATQKEQTQADCETIKAMAEAKSKRTLADAENSRKVEAAKAEAESRKMKLITEAEAVADAILLKARAEAEAIRLKAAAEAERAALLSKTNLGQQQCLFEIYADMVKTSNEGVDKVVYLDPSVNKNSPFALGSLDGLNRDLHSLTQIGIASSGGGSGTNGKNGKHTKHGKGVSLEAN
mmetsp:Transcript_137/g.357  ORF Transcript_137/g.357 Transcript_137/m.357 type:complete len:821 (+) Transcript_137:115-2577(+)